MAAEANSTALAPASVTLPYIPLISKAQKLCLKQGVKTAGYGTFDQLYSFAPL